jgi:glycine/D-amino acid oxidase-like deaminating enzyme
MDVTLIERGGIACDGALNPMDLSKGLFAKAHRLGAEMRTRTAVTGIRLDSAGGISRVDTDQGSIFTPRVVNAARIWAPHIVGNLWLRS